MRRMSVSDPEGEVFKENNTFFRGIYRKDSETLKLISNNDFREMVRAGFLPQVWEDSRPGKEGFYYRVLQSETAPFVTYPNEWSFDMFKDYCLFFLDFVDEAKGRGFKLKDGHPYNTVFFNTKPKFVDVGSLVPDSRLVDPWPEFKNTSLFPLLIWASGNPGLASLLICNCGQLSFGETLAVFKGLTLFRGMSPARYVRGLIGQIRHKALVGMNDTKKIREVVQNLFFEDERSFWKNYHKKYFSDQDQIIISPRFEKIVAIINDLKVETVSDIACNEGAFSILVSNQCPRVKRILSLDLDERVINVFYQKLKNRASNHKITLATNNFITPRHTYKQDFPEERFRSECVVALALTHHLLLDQKFNPTVVFERLHSYTKKYLVVEFMPLGLWGGGPLPPVPTFYTEKWFVEHLENYFIVEQRHNLEKNRICFVCRKREATPAEASR